MSSAKSKAPKNAVAQAMSAAPKKPSDADEQDEEGDFSHLEIDTQASQDIQNEYENSFSNEQPNSERNDSNGAANRNIDKSFDQPEFPGGM